MGKYDAEIEQERRQIEIREQIVQRHYSFYKKMIEQYLCEEKYNEVVALFEQKDVLELAQMDNEFAILNIIVNIHRMEQSEQVEYSIWGRKHTVRDVEDTYLKLKMYLWRLEFTEDQDSFIGYILEHQISIPCIKWLIHTSAFKKAETAYKIALLYKKREYFVQAFAMLYYLNELCSEEELVYCEMADIYMQLHRYEAAADCIKKIHHPSALFDKYKKKWDIDG